MDTPSGVISRRKLRLHPAPNAAVATAAPFTYTIFHRVFNRVVVTEDGATHTFKIV